MARLKTFLDNDTNVLECIIFLYDDNLNEMSDESFMALKKLGDKMGFKVSKSHSLFSLLKKFSKDVGNVIGLATKYHFATLTGNSAKASEIKQKLDKSLTKTTKKDVMSFFLQLDKNLLSLTSIPRHILQSFFGVEISTYNQWKSEKDYIIMSLEKVNQVLSKMDSDTREEQKILNQLMNSIKTMEY